MFNKRVSNEVKGVAIILMLMHHLFYCSNAFCQEYGLVTRPFEWTSLYKFSGYAKVCVSMYVFITAYGTTVSYNSLAKKKLVDRLEMGRFTVNRYIKLMINFWCIYLLALATTPLREASLKDIYGGGKTGILHGLVDAAGLSSFFGYTGLNETWWYMALAGLLIFIVPILIKGYKNCGFPLLIVAAYSTYIGISDSTFTRYLFCIILGIFIAEENLFDRIKRFKISRFKIVNSIVKCAVYVFFIVFLLYLRGKTNWIYWIDPMFAVAVSCLCMELHNVPMLINRVLEYLGKHSMNIFLVHTLIFEYYFTEFIYGFKHWILVLLALLLSSLLTSVVCEMVKKLIRIDKLIAKINTIISKRLFQIKES